MNTRRRILVDVDGVLADFVTAALRLIEDKTGAKFYHNDVKGFDVFESLGIDDKILRDAVRYEHFCLNIPPYAGAREFVNKLDRDYGDVYIVTVPFAERPWMGERAEWLTTHLGIPKSRQVHTHAKYIISGDVFIDDKVQNLVEWKGSNPSGLAIYPHTSFDQIMLVDKDREYTCSPSWDATYGLIENHLQTSTKAY